MPILGYCMALLLGICLYSTLQFGLAWLNERRHRTPAPLTGWFTLMCLFASGYIIAEMVGFHRPAPQAYLETMQYRTASGLLFMSCFPWFIRSFTGYAPILLLRGLTAIMFCFALFHLLTPAGLLFSDLSAVEQYRFSWGETVYFHAGDWTPINVVSWLCLLVIIAYSIAACRHMARNDNPRLALILGITLAFFYLIVFSNVLVRFEVLDFVYIAPYALPLLIGLVGQILHQQNREKQSQLQAVLDHVPAVVYIKDSDGRYVLVNRELENIYGMTREDVLGNTDHDLFQRRLADQWRNNDIEVLKLNEAIDFEEYTLHSDGSEHLYRSVKFPLSPLGSHRPDRIAGISMDITTERQTLGLVEQNEHKYRTLFESAGDAIVLLQDGCFTDCNEHALTLFGTSRDNIIGASPLDFSPPAQYDGQASESAAMRRIERALAGTPQFFEWLHTREDGSRIDTEVRLNRVRIDGEYCLQGIVRDVSERKEAEHALKVIAGAVSSQIGASFFHRLTSTLCTLFETRFAFIGILDRQNPGMVNTLAAVENGERVADFSYSLAGTPCEEVVGHKSCFFQDRVQQQFPADRLLVEMQAESYMACPIFDTEGQAVGLIAVLDTRPMRDVRHLLPVIDIFAARAAAELQRLEAEDRVYTLAYQDDLTKLPNRAALHEYLDTMLALTDAPLATLQLIDLDHFKTINDGLSHEIGDEVLKLVASRLQESAREQDFVAHLGADEFVVVSRFPALSLADLQLQAAVHAERLIMSLSRPLQLEHQSLTVGASCGVVLIPNHGDNHSVLMRRADLALHRAKQQGHSNIQFFEAAMQEHVDTRLNLEAGLRQALEQQQFSLEFQPLVSAAGEPRGAEALLRWDHPEMGRIGPDRFIPIAEETGLIHDIGHWVLEQVCQHLRVWQQHQGFGGYVSVNVSAWEFANPRYVSQVIDTLETHRIAAERIVLELTESALLYDVGETVRKINELRSHGLRVAMDDFGTGYSSLAYLQKFHMDILKVDRMFTNEVTGYSHHPLVETITVLGRNMQMDVIAEGVERQEQVEILIRLDCQLFQGYYFCRPLPVTEFCRWVAERSPPDDH